ncbi:hypothetical protein [Lactococcus lactis]|uniref:hypothetical protein n=1 Tax=Lactococcus lactis TaxID=1358 RepID=UPI00339811F0
MMNEKNYMQLLFIFSDFRDNQTKLTLFWPNGSILKGVSEVGISETDSDIPEDSPEYPGYYSTFLDNVEVIYIDKRDLGEFDNRYRSIEIDMVNAPLIVKANDEIVWEKED